MYQQTTIIARVGSEIETRYTPSGKMVANFSAAVNEKYGGNEQTTWFRVACWEKLAEIAGQYLGKGQLIMVTGRVSARAYTTKSGEAACSLELVAQTIKMLGGKGNGASEPAGDGMPNSLDDVESVPF